jgi:hypothetical protein
LASFLFSERLLLSGFSGLPQYTNISAILEAIGDRFRSDQVVQTDEMLTGQKAAVERTPDALS